MFTPQEIEEASRHLPNPNQRGHGARAYRVALLDRITCLCKKCQYEPVKFREIDFYLERDLLGQFFWAYKGVVRV